MTIFKITVLYNYDQRANRNYCFYSSFSGLFLAMFVLLQSIVIF